MTTPMLGNARIPSPRSMQLTEADRAVMARAFWVEDPRSIDGLEKRLAPDDHVVGVEFTYDVRRKMDCSACGRGHNHMKGFVVRLKNGRRAAIGYDCGETKHDLTYRDRIRDFDAELRRHQALRRAMETIDDVRPMCLGLVKLQGRENVKEMRRLGRWFARAFPDLWAWLLQSDDGAMTRLVKVQDADAEAKRDAELERRLERLARRHGKDREEEGMDRWLIATYLAEDAVADRSPLYRRETRIVGRFKGVGFVHGVPGLDATVRGLMDRAAAAVSPIEGASTVKLPSPRMLVAATEFNAVRKDGDDLVRRVRNAAKFLDNGNLDLILEQANKHRGIHAAGTFSRIGKVITRTLPGGGIVTLDVTMSGGDQAAA